METIITKTESNHIIDIYNKLLDAFGFRNWWPTKTRDEMIISAILTQNVSWNNAKTALANLNRAGISTLNGLVSADFEVIAKSIKPARFYNQKTVKLKTFSQFILDQFEGSLDRMFADDISVIRPMLLSLKGLGKETTDSILLYAGNKAIFVVDAYTKRIYSRIGLIEESWSYERIQSVFSNSLKGRENLFQDYHAQIVHLGHYYCLKKHPLCDNCPIVKDCHFYSADKC